MKSRFPFGSTVNPAASVKLDAAQREVESWQPEGWKPGDKGGVFRGTLADLARSVDVTPQALRGRLKLRRLPIPSEVTPAPETKPEATGKDSSPAGGRDPGDVASDPENRGGGEDEKRLQDASNQGVMPKGNSKGVFHAPDAYRMAPAIETQSQLSPRSALELSPLAQAEHDAEIAQLVRDSIGAFRKGKSKGPNNRRIIPIAKVGDLQVLDTLFRRATGQTKGEGAKGANLIQVNVLNRISRETVRPEAEGTSQLVTLNTVTKES